MNRHHPPSTTARHGRWQRATALLLTTVSIGTLAAAIPPAAPPVPTVTARRPAPDPDPAPRPGRDVLLALAEHTDHAGHAGHAGYAGRARAVSAGRSAGERACLHVQRWFRHDGRQVVADSYRQVRPDGAGRVIERRRTRTGPSAPFTPFGPFGPFGSVTGADVPASPQLAAVPTDPASWPGHLTATNPGADDVMVLAVILDLVGVRYLERPQRAALLRVIAELPGITSTGPRTDLLHRPGRGFTLTRADTRVDVVVDPSAGELLAHEWRTPIGDPTVTLLLDRAAGVGCIAVPADATEPGLLLSRLPVSSPGRPA